MIKLPILIKKKKKARAFKEHIYNIRAYIQLHRKWNRKGRTCMSLLSKKDVKLNKANNFLFNNKKKLKKMY